MCFHLSDLGLYVISLKRDFLIITLAKADLLYYSLGLFPSQDITICNFFFFWTPWSVKIGTISVCSDIFFFFQRKGNEVYVNCKTSDGWDREFESINIFLTRALNLHLVHTP